MKPLIILFFIISLHSWTKADDIRDFEIEGISIGDSLLEFFDERKLIDGIRQDSYLSSDLTYVDINLEENWFTEYEGLQITVKRNDNKYVAHSIDGNIFFNRNKKKCMSKMEKIVEDLSSFFDANQFQKLTNNTHYADPTGKSKVYGSSVFLETGLISVYCYLWDESMGVQYYVSVSTKNDEFNKWLSNL